MSFKFNPFTGQLDRVICGPPNKIIYSDEDINVLTNTFIFLVEPDLEGTSTLNVEGTGIVKVF